MNDIKMFGGNSDVISNLFGNSADVLAPQMPTETQQGNQQGFINLLEMVKDIEVSGSQDFSNAEFLSTESEKLKDKVGPREVSVLEIQNEIMNSEAIGRLAQPVEMNQNINFAEIKGSKNTQGNLELLTPVNISGNAFPMVDLKSEHVEAWALGFASGDIQKVEVGKIPDLVNQPSVASHEIGKLLDHSNKAVEDTSKSMRTQTQFEAISQKPQKIITTVENQSKMGMSQVDMKAPKGVENSLVESKISNLENPLVAQTEKVQKRDVSKLNAASSEFERVSPRRVDQNSEFVLKTKDESIAVPLRASSSNSKSGKIEKEKNSGQVSVKQEQSPNQSSKASDFILSQFTVDSKMSEAKPAILNLETLGNSQDLRIAPNSVDFLSEKIEALKSQGGGMIRVEMNPQDLGGLEIKVSQARGRLVVELKVEKDSTLKVFENSKGELSRKLDDLTPTNLSIASTDRSMKGISQGEISGMNQKPSPTTANTLDVMTAIDRLSAESNRSARSDSSDSGNNLSLRTTQNSLETKNSEAFGEHGRDRGDDSRSRALDFWEERFLTRQSA
jgi:hypothetical protein